MIRTLDRNDLLPVDNIFCLAARACRFKSCLSPLLHRYSFNTSATDCFWKHCGKEEEIVCKEQFLLFPQCFLLNQIIVSPFVHIFYIISLLAAEFEEPKNGRWGKELTHYQMTNFIDSAKLKEFTDSYFKFDENGRKLSKQVENTVGKGEIACYEQFLLFPQCFQKACFQEASKGVIQWEWVNWWNCFYTIDKSLLFFSHC